MHFSASALITVVLATAVSAQATTYSAWVSGSETSITFGQAQETSSVNHSTMSGMSGMSMSGMEGMTMTTKTTKAGESVASATSGASFGLSATASGAATVSTAGAHPQARVGAGVAGLAGVVAYALI